MEDLAASSTNQWWERRGPVGPIGGDFTQAVPSAWNSAHTLLQATCVRPPSAVPSTQKCSMISPLPPQLSQAPPLFSQGPVLPHHSPGGHIRSLSVCSTVSDQHELPKAEPTPVLFSQ